MSNDKKKIEKYIMDIYGDKITFDAELEYMNTINYTKIETPSGMIFVRHCSPSQKGDSPMLLWNFL